jgi:hypothetical protein
MLVEDTFTIFDELCNFSTVLRTLEVRMDSKFDTSRTVHDQKGSLGNYGSLPLRALPGTSIMMITTPTAKEILIPEEGTAHSFVNIYPDNS